MKSHPLFNNVRAERLQALGSGQGPKKLHPQARPTQARPMHAEPDSYADRYQANSASTTESILTVTLAGNPELEREYSEVFFPTKERRKKVAAPTDDGSPAARTVKTSKFGTQPEHYPDLVRYLTEVSAATNAYLAQFRYLVREAPGFQVMPDKAYQKSLIDRQLRTITASFTPDTYGLGYKSLLSSIGSGKAHILRPSTKFKGGYDIIYSGLPQFGNTVGTAVSLSTQLIDGLSIPDTPKSIAHQEDAGPGGAYTLPIGSAAVAAAAELVATLMEDKGAVALASMHERKLTMLPLSTDFNAIFSKIRGMKALAVAGIDPGLPTLKPLDPAILAGLGKYVSILVIREASHAVVRRKIADPSVSPDLVISEQYAALAPIVGFSLVIHLQKELCEFITQTPKGSRMSLTALSTWTSTWSSVLFRVPNQRRTKGGPKQPRVKIRHTPRYVLPASGMKALAAQRKELGFFSEPGRTNSEDLFVSSKGTLNYCPKAADMSSDNAVAYEAILEEALQLSFDAGSPLQASQLGETNPVFGLASPDYKLKITTLKAKIKKYGGSVQAYSWDYNCILTSAKSEPDRLIPMDLSGTAVPDSLSVADYLRKPFAKAMQLMFVDSSSGVTGAHVTPESFGHGGSVQTSAKTTPFINTFQLYAYLLSKKTVPNFSELVKSAASSMGMRSIQDPDFVNYERGLYNGIISDDFVPAQLHSPTASADAQVSGIEHMLSMAMRDSSGYPSSNLSRAANKAGTAIEEDPHFFSAEHFTLAEFKNIYSYLGGRVFFLMLQAIAKADRKTFMEVDPESDAQGPNFQVIVTEVMPLVHMLSKYVPESDEIYERADVLAEGNKRDTSISAADIHVPGSSDSFQMFPHQVGAHQYLRNHPRFAVLDIAPGGGKTILLLSDVAALVREKKINRACVLAPNGLVRNWVEDMHAITQGKWNIIPITTASFKLWEDERLTKMLQKAPRNTIVVIGTSVLKTRPYPVVIGNHVERVSAVLEFVKKFGFDYVALDESHRAKNPRTANHKAIKQLTTASNVKYVRLATGTLISNKLTDVVGQAALFNSQIFRTPEEYESENKEQVGETKIYRWRDDTAHKAREQLSKHSAVITVKRKEWAFMLPVPQERFITVSMEKDTSEGGLIHQLMYDSILKETMEDIKKDTNLMAMLSGKGDSEGEGDGDEDDGDGDEDDDGTADAPEDMDDALVQELEARLNPYLARLEQMLTDPVGDPFGATYFEGLNSSNFVSNKVLKIIERIKLSFADIEWEKGREYKLKTVVDIDGQRYVLMPPKGVPISNTEVYHAPYRSVKSPVDDVDRWKKEPRGKVLVFCRYKRSVEAIYRALPADLKKIAVKFHGDVKDKQSGLDAFKADPLSRTKGAQILIANEQSISEGHNLQMADRMIRVEAPWAPGELDQSASRIFRPDPSGKFSRENIYLDWVLTNGSLEVAKMGRLISKMITKAQFDEDKNPLYADINVNELPPIPMGLDTIKSVPLIADILPYIESYQNLVSIQSAEFAEMRATRPSKMFDIEPEPMIEDAKIIEFVPYVPNMRIPDRHGFGLVKLMDYLQDADNEDAKAVAADYSKLVGMYAHTEMGNGTVVRISQSRPDKDAPDATRKLTRVWVKLAGSEDVYDGPPSMINLATNLDEETIKNFEVKVPWATKGDKRRAERLRAAAERKALSDAKKLALRKLREQKALEKLRQLEKLKTAKPKPRPRVEEPEDEEPEEDENNNVELFPVVYNGFLALEAITEDEDILLKHYGFRKFGDYAYVAIKDYQTFTGVLDYLTSKFTLSSVILRRLNSLHDSFVSGRGRKFAVEQAPISELRNFYMLSHKLSVVDKTTRKPELKVYPVILGDVLMLNIDIATNPAVRKILGKVIPGTKSAKFASASGIEVIFLPTKNDLIRKVKEMEAEGFVITNKDQLKTEVAALNLARAKK